MVGEKHVEDVENFLKEYGKQLRSIEEALRETISEVWNPQMDPIALKLVPYEQTNILELVKTENTAFNKVLLVFASLCKETTTLIKTVWFRMFLILQFISFIFFFFLIRQDKNFILLFLFLDRSLVMNLKKVKLNNKLEE